MTTRKSNYWQKRQETLLDKSVDELTKRLGKSYVDSAKRIRREIEKIYIKITDADGNVNVNDLYQYNRYYSYLSMLNKELDLMGKHQILLYQNAFEKLYKDNGHLLTEQFGFKPFLDTAVADKATQQVWCADGKLWSARVWKNTDKLKTELARTLVDSVAMGRPMEETAKEIASRLTVSFSRARTLANTEMAHIQNYATLDRYRQAGVEEYEVLVEPDACDDCQELNGQTFKTSMVEPIIPLHPNCRCCILPVLEGSTENSEEDK